jgi:hypothetical protein
MTDTETSSSQLTWAVLVASFVSACTALLGRATLGVAWGLSTAAVVLPQLRLIISRQRPLYIATAFFHLLDP